MWIYACYSLIIFETKWTLSTMAYALENLLQNGTLSYKLRAVPQCATRRKRAHWDRARRTSDRIDVRQGSLYTVDPFVASTPAPKMHRRTLSIASRIPLILRNVCDGNEEKPFFFIIRKRYSLWLKNWNVSKYF